MRSLGRVDVTIYARAALLLVRFPQLVVGPLLAAVLQLLLLSAIPMQGEGTLGFTSASISGLIAQLIGMFGLALAIAGASSAWRRDRAPLDEAWDETTKKAGDIFLSAIGFTFVVWAAGMLGAFLPFGMIGTIALTLAAYFFFIYTLPAATIGGIPGGAALQISFERARLNPLPTLAVTACYLFAFRYAPVLVLALLAPVMRSNALFSAGLVGSLVVMSIRAVLSAYVALVLAKTYEDVSYGRRY